MVFKSFVRSSVVRECRMEYQCKICKLHYTKKELAVACYAWCSTHEDSCNLQITKKSIEAKGDRK